MKKTIKWVVIVLIVAIFVGTFVFLWKKSQPKETVYEINSVELKDLEKSTILTGKIEPRDEVNIKPQISGIIAELYKQAGDVVQKDEVIAKVKVIPEMGSLASAENRVTLAEISLNRAQADFDRTKRLYTDKVISVDEYEKAEVTLKNAKAELSNAKDNLNIIRNGVSLSNAQMSTTLIRSTIDGLILNIPVKIGNSVILANTMNEGTTIATIADMKKLIFRGKIDETEVGRVKEGMPVEITVGAIPDMRFDALIEYISPKAEESNGANQFEIKAAIAVPDSVSLRSGYGANAQIVLERASQTPAIPEASLTFEDGKTYVYVLTDSVPKQKFRRQEVKTGLSDGINIQVKSGVKVGEKVRGIEKAEDK